MKKELNDYIVLSRNNNILDEEIKKNLLSKGWDIKEIEESFFTLSGGDKSQLKSSIEDLSILKRKNIFASVSIILSILGIILFVFNAIISLLIVFIGLIFGILGINSKRKKQAIFGVCFNSLLIIIIILNMIYTVNLLITGKNIFTGRTLSDQEIYDLGFTSEDIKNAR